MIDDQPLFLDFCNPNKEIITKIDLSLYLNEGECYVGSDSSVLSKAL